MNKPLSALALAGLLLSGCSLTPEYQRPEAPLEAAYPGVAPAAAVDEEAVRVADIGWRDFFADARLQALIEAALESNRDLRRAALNVEQARALYDIREADQWPSVGVGGSATRQRTPGGVSPTGEASTNTRYEVGVTLSAWELDFFGRLDSLSEVALAEYLATEEARRAAQISLVAEVARVYLAERAAAEQLELARQTLEARRGAFDLVRQRYEAGAASRLDLQQADVLVQSARVSVAALTRQHAQALNALNLLVGETVADLPQAQPLSAQTVLSDLPPGLPSELLSQRPDIRAAERQLMAANANIGAARAAFFPRITLTAGVGTASGELSELFSSDTGTWSFMPQLVLPIFDAGRNRTNLRLAEVRENIAVVEYEQTIQNAFREVADALVAREALDEQVEAQERLLEAQAGRLQLAEQRYQGGVASFLEVLDARRELFDAEQSLLQTRQLRLTNTIDLYRALGGGLAEYTARNQAPEAPEVDTEAEG